MIANARGVEGSWIDAELSPPIEVHRPKTQTAPLVFCSPHSGRIYPAGFLRLSRLDAMALRKSEDCFVDALFAGVVNLGAPLIAARFPRAYVDVNREPYELDPEVFSERPPAFANTQSVRVLGGLGTIPRVVADGEEIYGARLPLHSAFERIERLYRPFHSELAELIETTRRQFGVAVLVDCHSMPSASLDQPNNPRPHFVIGDRFGTACDPQLTRLVRETLARLGYDVQLNRPYAGGFITEHYGRPLEGVHAIQIEINRALYLNEANLVRSEGFAALEQSLLHLVGRLATALPFGGVRRIAAE